MLTKEERERFYTRAELLMLKEESYGGLEPDEVTELISLKMIINKDHHEIQAHIVASLADISQMIFLEIERRVQNES